MRDYTHKTVYIGIDVHKKTYAVTAICGDIVVKRDTLTAQPENLISYIKKFFSCAKIKTAYEAGFSGFHLHRCLLAESIDNIVVHAGSIKAAANDRVKTDKRDSLNIAKQLSRGELRSINVPTKKRENLRAITRIRDQLLKTKQRIGNQLKSYLFTQGLMDLHDDTRISKTWIKKLQAELPTNLEEEVKYCIDMYIDLWFDLDKRLQEILLKIHAQADKDKTDIIYRSVPGVGALSARTLANELEDMKHFRNIKGLFSYTGLTPSEYSSGEHKRLGNISRQGKAKLRMILVQIAWRSIKIDKHLLEVFERISKKAGKKRAIVAVARKIIGCIRTCFINGELWNINAPDTKQPSLIKAEACLG
jgi:transposase